jgi:hypothetical protein
MRMNEQVEMHSQLYIIHNNRIEIHYERKIIFEHSFPSLPPLTPTAYNILHIISYAHEQKPTKLKFNL